MDALRVEIKADNRHLASPMDDLEGGLDGFGQTYGQLGVNLNGPMDSLAAELSGHTDPGVQLLLSAKPKP